MLRTRQCVLNLPSVEQVSAVNKLARTTGTNPVPKGKLLKGYRFEADKFGVSGLTSVQSQTIDPVRVKECPVQMEAVVEAVHGIAEDDAVQSGRIITVELRIQRVHLEESILMDGFPSRVDPDKWRPLIMSFQQFYGLGPRVHNSTLAQIPEVLYHSPDMERAQTV